jgi:hypothetical protein
MRRVAIFGIAAAMLLLGTGSSRADSCETYAGSQVYTDQCGPGSKAQPPAQTGTPPAYTQSTGLRELLRRALQRKNAPALSAAQKEAIDDAEQRWGEAQARAQDATYRAQQTDDPALKTQLKQQYESAMRDLHQAGADLIKADPQQKTKIQALIKDYDAQGAKAALAAGLEPPPKAASAAPQPQQAAAPANVTQIGDNTYVCDGAIAGANNVSCRQISADGKRCTNVTLADGDVSWQDSIETRCQAGDLAQRKAFLARDKDAAAAVAHAQPAFAMGSDETRREIDRLSRPALTAALDELPKQCRADFEKFLASGEAKSKANAAQAAASYAKLDKNPQCRDAIKRIAAALNVGLPHRMIAAGDRNDWNAALAGPQRANIEEIPDIDVSNIPDTGFDPGDSLDSAIDMLNALSGGLGALSGSMRSMPSYRPAPAYRAPAPSYPRATSCNVNGCTLSNGAGGNSGSGSDITGTH